MSNVEPKDFQFKMGLKREKQKFRGFCKIKIHILLFTIASFSKQSSLKKKIMLCFRGTESLEIVTLLQVEILMDKL